MLAKMDGINSSVLHPNPIAFRAIAFQRDTIGEDRWGNVPSPRRPTFRLYKSPLPSLFLCCPCFGNVPRITGNISKCTISWFRIFNCTEPNRFSRLNCSICSMIESQKSLCRIVPLPKTKNPEQSSIKRALSSGYRPVRGRSVVSLCREQRSLFFAMDTVPRQFGIDPRGCTNWCCYRPVLSRQGNYTILFDHIRLFFTL